MAPKPTEIKMVAALLEEEHPDAQSLARSIILALDEKRLSDPQFILGTMYDGLPLVWGPFATANQAAKAASKLAMPRTLEGRVLRLYRITDTPDGVAT
jgi:hypothetical protein